MGKKVQDLCGQYIRLRRNVRTRAGVEFAAGEVLVVVEVARQSGAYTACSRTIDGRRLRCPRSYYEFVYSAADPEYRKPRRMFK